MVAPVQTSLMTSRRLWTCDCSCHGVTVLRVAPSRSRVLAAGQARVGAERRASSQARVEQACGRRYLSGAEERFSARPRERPHTLARENRARERERARLAGGKNVDIQVTKGPRSRATLSDLDDKSKVERAGGESNGRVSTPSELARSLL